ncbi:MAG: hypothetical protein J5I94_10265, partial [Phaeodactylibacter sp.]|nr:hypothetical protein [Phaeodactylibacter sp.]
MILFFGSSSHTVFAVQVEAALADEDIAKLSWLFGGQPQIDAERVEGLFVGPRAAMVSPWSTNAVEITQNMGIQGIRRIEQFDLLGPGDDSYDPMLTQKYKELHQDIFTIDIEPEPIREVEDIAAYNEKEGLALSEEEIRYLEEVAERIGRKLTDSEVFGFSQVNSEHCRHKIFNGTFIIDGREQPDSLFSLIKKTSKANPNSIVSAYKDNVAFLKGPRVRQFAPRAAGRPDYYEKKEFDSV